MSVSSGPDCYVVMCDGAGVQLRCEEAPNESTAKAVAIDWCDLPEFENGATVVAYVRDEDPDVVAIELSSYRAADRRQGDLFG